MSAARKIDAFQVAFEKFKAAHKSILDLDRKKLFPAKAAGDALIEMKEDKGCTIDDLLDMLHRKGITLSQDTHNRYVKVASRWEEIGAIAKKRKVDLKTLGYMEALDLLPLSQHAQRVKAGKQKKKLATEPGSAPQAPPTAWKGKVISLHGKDPVAEKEPEEAKIKSGDPSDAANHPTEEENGEQKPTEPPKQLMGNQKTKMHFDCHNFQIDGNSLQCLDQVGQTVILVAMKGQQMADMLNDALGHKPKSPPIKERIEHSMPHASPLPDIMNMNPIEISHAFRKLMRGGTTVAQIADHYRLTKEEMRNHLKLLKLRPEEQEQVAKGKLSFEDACKRVDRQDARLEATAKKPTTKKPAKNQGGSK